MLPAGAPGRPNAAATAQSYFDASREIRAVSPPRRAAQVKQRVTEMAFGAASVSAIVVLRRGLNPRVWGVRRLEAY